MEEDKRKQKLKAGKEKLAAFQKKKAKRKRHGDDPSEVSSSSDVPYSDSDDLSNSADEGSKDDSRILVETRSALHLATQRITELEELVQGKQLALDKLVEENEQLKEGNQSHKMLEFEAAIRKRDEIIQQLSAHVQTAGGATDAMYAAATEAMAKEVQQLQEQLIQSGKLLQSQTGKQIESSQILQQAKLEVQTLHQKLSEKDSVLTQMEEKFTHLYAECDQLKSTNEELRQKQTTSREKLDSSTDSGEQEDGCVNERDIEINLLKKELSESKRKEQETGEVVKKLMMDVEEIRKKGGKHVPTDMITKSDMEETLERITVELDEKYGLQISQMKSELLKQFYSDTEKLNGEILQRNEEYEKLLVQYRESENIQKSLQAELEQFIHSDSDRSKELESLSKKFHKISEQLVEKCDNESALESEKEKMIIEVNRLEKESSDFKIEKENLEKELADLEVDKEKLLRQLRDSENRTLEMETILEDKNKMFRDSEQKIFELEKAVKMEGDIDHEIQRLKLENESVRNAVEDYQRKVATVEEENLQLLAEKEKMVLEVDQLNKELDQLSQYSRKHEQVLKEVDELKLQLTEQKSMVEVFEEQSVQSMAEKEKMALELDQLNEEFEQVSQQAQKHEQVLKDVEELTVQLNGLQHERQTLRTQNDELKNKINLQQDSVISQKSQLQTLAEENAGLKDRVSQVEQENEILKTNETLKEVCKADVEELKITIEDREKDLKVLKDNMEKLRSENCSYIEKIAKLEEMIVHYNSEDPDNKCLKYMESVTVQTEAMINEFEPVTSPPEPVTNRLEPVSAQLEPVIEPFLASSSAATMKTPTEVSLDDSSREGDFGMEEILEKVVLQEVIPVQSTSVSMDEYVNQEDSRNRVDSVMEVVSVEANRTLGDDVMMSEASISKEVEGAEKVLKSSEVIDNGTCQDTAVHLSQIESLNESLRIAKEKESEYLAKVADLQQIVEELNKEKEMMCKELADMNENSFSIGAEMQNLRKNVQSLESDRLVLVKKLEKVLIERDSLVKDLQGRSDVEPPTKFDDSLEDASDDSREAIKCSSLNDSLEDNESQDIPKETCSKEENENIGGYPEMVRKCMPTLEGHLFSSESSSLFVGQGACAFSSVDTTSVSQLRPCDPLPLEEISVIKSREDEFVNNYGGIQPDQDLLKLKILQLEKDLSNNAAERSEILSTMENVSSLCKRQRLENESLMLERDKMKQENDILRESLNKLQEDLNETREQLEEKNRKLSDMEERYEDTKSSYDRVQDHYDMLGDEYHSLQLEHDQLIGQFDQLQQENVTLTKSVQDSEILSSKIFSESEDLMQRLGDLEQTNEENMKLKGKCQALEEECEILKSENFEVKENCEQLEKHNNDNQKHLTSLEEQLCSMTIKNHRNWEKIDKLTKENIEIQEELKKKNEDLKSLNSSCSEMQIKLGTLEGERANFLEKLKILENKSSEKDKLKTENENIRSQLRMVTLDMNGIKNKNEKMKEDMKKMEAKMEEQSKKYEDVIKNLSDENLKLKHGAVQEETNQTVISDLTKSLERTLHEKQSLQENNDALSVQVEEFLRMRNDLDEKLKIKEQEFAQEKMEYEDRIDSLNIQVEEFMRMREDLEQKWNRRLLEKEEKSDQDSVDVQSVKEKLSELERKLAEKCENFNEIVGNIKIIETENETLQSKVSRQNDVIEELENRVKHLNLRLTEREKFIDRISSENESLKFTLRDMEKSWQVEYDEWQFELKKKEDEITMLRNELSCEVENMLKEKSKTIDQLKSDINEIRSSISNTESQKEDTTDGIKVPLEELQKNLCKISELMSQGSVYPDEINTEAEEMHMVEKSGTEEHGKQEEPQTACSSVSEETVSVADKIKVIELSREVETLKEKLQSLELDKNNLRMHLVQKGNLDDSDQMEALCEENCRLMNEVSSLNMALEKMRKENQKVKELKGLDELITLRNYVAVLKKEWETIKMYINLKDQMEKTSAVERNKASDEHEIEIEEEQKDAQIYQMEVLIQQAEKQIRQAEGKIQRTEGLIHQVEGQILQSENRSQQTDGQSMSQSQQTDGQMHGNDVIKMESDTNSHVLEQKEAQIKKLTDKILEMVGDFNHLKSQYTMLLEQVKEEAKISKNTTVALVESMEINAKFQAEISSLQNEVAVMANAPVSGEESSMNVKEEIVGESRGTIESEAGVRKRLEERIEELEMHLTISQSENEENLMQIERSKSNLSQSYDMNKELQGKVDSLEEQVMKINEIYDKVKGERDQLEGMVVDLRSKRKEVSSEMKQLSKQIEILERRNEDLDEEFKNLKLEKVDNEAKIISTLEENKFLKSRIQELESSENDTKKEHSSEVHEHVDIQKLLTTVKKQEDEMAEMMSKNMSLVDENELLRKVKEDFDKVKRERDKFVSLHEALSEDLNEMQTKYESVRSLMDDTKKECNNEIEKLQEQLSNVNMDVTGLKGTLEGLELEMSHTVEQKMQLMSSLEEERSRRQEVVAEQERLKDKFNKDLQNQRKANEAMLANLSNEEAEVSDSTSSRGNFDSAFETGNNVLQQMSYMVLTFDASTQTDNESDVEQSAISVLVTDYESRVLDLSTEVDSLRYEYDELKYKHEKETVELQKKIDLIKVAGSLQEEFRKVAEKSHDALDVSQAEEEVSSNDRLQMVASDCASVSEYSRSENKCIENTQEALVEEGRGDELEEHSAVNTTKSCLSQEVDVQTDINMELYEVMEKSEIEKSIEKQCVEKLQSLEYEMEEKLAFQLRGKQTEMLDKFEKEKKELRGEFEQCLKRKVEIVQAEKHQEFVEALRKMKKDFEKKLGKERRKREKMRKYDGDDTMEEEDEKNVVKRLKHENQVLAEARDEMMRQIDQLQKENTELKGENEDIDENCDKSRSSSRFSYRSQSVMLDWELSPYSSFDQDREHPGNAHGVITKISCQRPECQVLFQKYMGLVDQVQTIGYELDGDDAPDSSFENQGVSKAQGFEPEALTPTTEMKELFTQEAIRKMESSRSQNQQFFDNQLEDFENSIQTSDSVIQSEGRNEVQEHFIAEKDQSQFSNIPPVNFQNRMDLLSHFSPEMVDSDSSDEAEVFIGEGFVSMEKPQGAQITVDSLKRDPILLSSAEEQVQSVEGTGDDSIVQDPLRISAKRYVKCVEELKIRNSGNIQSEKTDRSENILKLARKNRQEQSISSDEDEDFTKHRRVNSEVSHNASQDVFLRQDSFEKEALQQEINRLQFQNTFLEERIKNVECLFANEKLILVKKLDEVKMQLENMNTEKSHLEKEIEILKNSTNKFVEENEISPSGIHDINNETNPEALVSPGWSVEKEKLPDLMNENLRKDQEIKNLKEQIFVLSIEKTEKEYHQIRMEENMENMQEVIEVLQRKLNEEVCEESEAETEKLNAVKTQFKRDLEKKEETVSSLQSQNEELHVKLKALEKLSDDLSKATEEIQMLNDEAKLKEQLSTDSEEVLRRDLRVKEEELAGMINTVDRLECQLREHEQGQKLNSSGDEETELLTVKAEVFELKETLVDKERYIAELEREIRRLDEGTRYDQCQNCLELEKAVKEKDVYIRKLEEHLLGQDMSQLPSRSSSREITPTQSPRNMSSNPRSKRTTPEQVSRQLNPNSLAVSSENSSRVIGQNFESQALVSDDFIPTASLRKENRKLNMTSDRKYGSVGRDPGPLLPWRSPLDDFSDQSTISVSSSQRVAKDTLKSLFVPEMNFSVRSRSPSSSSIVSDGSDRIISGLGPDQDGHVALEHKHFELIDEISQLRRDLRETKSIYTQENALLQEALERETWMKETMRSKLGMSGTVVNFDLSTELISLRQKVAILQETNKMLHKENDQWLRKVQDQEQLVINLKEVLGHDLDSFGDVDILFGKQVLLLQKQRDELLENLRGKDSENNRLSHQIGDMNVIEENLRREKDLLKVKLQEKEDVEAELNQKKLELERQVQHQQKLEDIIYHKNEIEKELMKQKRLLELDFSEIESKLQEKEELLEIQKTQLLQELKEKGTSQSSGECNNESKGKELSKEPLSSVCRLNEMLEEAELQHSSAIQNLKDKYKTEYRRKEDAQREAILSVTSEHEHKV